MTATLVRDFLSALETRDLDAAAGFLGPGFTMTFPGGVTMSSLEELVEWSRGRYRSVAKSYHDFDELLLADRTVIYCFGFLTGVALDGTSIENVRFIDRFEIQQDKIIDQKVWNDLAEFVDLKHGSSEN